ncbi:MAG: helix-turn-helix transcriptional regulator, partial [Eggerthellaceae bacterium]|nr:helix-turn-helix transcriptional regulator [Eggerthellaceae bacterium]
MASAIALGNNIYQLRKETRLTQDDLATFLGVTKASVSKWETGQSFPDIELLPKIATYFAVT